MKTNSQHAIETESLTKTFGRKKALWDLTMHVPHGGVHAVVGSNGAGKSTLFRVLLGLLEPNAGKSSVLGVDSRELTPEVRGRIGLVHEEHTLPAWMKAKDLLALHRSLYPRWNEKTLREVVGHFNVLPEQKVAQLSRGERAGLNLAIALAQEPELLILDEPTLGLDVVAKQAFLESLLFVGENPARTIVYCSHQMDEIERVADNLLILERGELVSMSAPEDFLGRISYWVAEGLESPRWEAEVPGLLENREIDGQRHLVILDRDEHLPERLGRLGASSVECVPVGLDRAVNAFLTRNHATPGL